jgi:hypothetical protein
MGALGSFPFLFPSLVEKRTVETEFWDNFIVLHAGDVNQNGAILSQAFVKYGHNPGTFFSEKYIFFDIFLERRSGQILGEGLDVIK